MLTIHDYHFHKKKDYLVTVNHEEPLCPKCQSIMTIRDSYRRKVKDSYGDSYSFRLRRLYCSSCNRLHAEIPDVITAFKQYDTDTIKGVINGNIKHFSGDVSTAYRWKKHTPNLQ
ncbi:MAG: hypothetical protein IKO36_00580 [Bacteroidaceae bacterium]|nr:hypothetical protein [Bacteroidaceae bacterium]